MHKIQCECGALSGHIEGEGSSNRVSCYCGDCQAFARYLGRANDILDAQGGTEIVQLAQHRVVFSHGKQHLAAMQLSENGLLRWFTTCCNSPIGNTVNNSKFSFIGLFSASLERSRIDQDFGTAIAIVNADSALDEPKPQQRGVATMVLRVFKIVVTSLVTGKYRDSEFFKRSGEPAVSQIVLTAAERKLLNERN